MGVNSRGENPCNVVHDPLRTPRDGPVPRTSCILSLEQERQQLLERHRPSTIRHIALSEHAESLNNSASRSGDVPNMLVPGLTSPIRVNGEVVVPWKQVEQALAMVQEALQAKQKMSELLLEEANRLRQEQEAERAQMTRAEEDSGTLRDEVENLMQVKRVLGQEKAELERMNFGLLAERDLLCEQLQVDPADGNLVQAVQGVLGEARQGEALKEEVQQLRTKMQELEVDLKAVKARYRRGRQIWNSREKTFLRVIEAQALYHRAVYLQARKPPKPIAFGVDKRVLMARATRKLQARLGELHTAQQAMGDWSPEVCRTAAALKSIYSTPGGGGSYQDLVDAEIALALSGSGKSSCSCGECASRCDSGRQSCPGSYELYSDVQTPGRSPCIRVLATDRMDSKAPYGPAGGVPSHWTGRSQQDSQTREEMDMFSLSGGDGDGGGKYDNGAAAGDMVPTRHGDNGADACSTRTILQQKVDMCPDSTSLTSRWGSQEGNLSCLLTPQVARGVSEDLSSLFAAGMGQVDDDDPETPQQRDLVCASPS